MSRHDYSMMTVDYISNQLENCRFQLENTTYSCENMSYLWTSNLVGSVVTWLEVHQLALEKSGWVFFFQDAGTIYSKCVQKMGQADSTAANALAEVSSTLQALQSKVSLVSDHFAQAVPTPGNR